MLTDLPEWKALTAHRQAMESVRMRDLFTDNPQRFAQFSLQIPGVLFDYSKHRATAETMALLQALARARDVTGWRDRMFAGDRINTTENRAVLHTALRRPAADSVMVDGENVMPFIYGVLAKMRDFSNAVRSGAWTGHTGQRIKDVVNIGIGGSDLGPLMVCEALKHLADGPAVHFVSNVDGAHLAMTLQDLDPASTLFIVASKTFTTQETMANAASAREWLVKALGDEKAVAKHFVALSTNEAAVTAFGIAADNMFQFRDWVGGRYSLWSAIGLSICLANGFTAFRALLDGAYAMDRHFQTAAPERNMPMIMALLGLWYRDFWDAQTYAVLPYSQNLHRLPAFLQQLDMESNGKHVGRDGRTVTWQTGPVLFGEAGTNGQHAFYQLIHQGTSMIPCDFIGIIEAPVPLGDHHKLLLANVIAQSQALMQGRTLAETDNNPHKEFDGNRPSTTVLLDRLDPHHLGQLLALYEHKVFVQGIIWGINSFDQWGVELGKVLAGRILTAMDKGGAPDNADSSTAGLLAHLRKV